MKIYNTKFKGLKVIRGTCHNDSRGYFREIFLNRFLKKKKLIFWCMSKSKRNVLRGLHLQKKIHQEKYISVVKGKIFDVVVDLRKKSKTYGKYFCIILSDKNLKSLFVPSGFAHGFCALDKDNLVLYGLSNYRSKKNEIGISWKDNLLKIKWPKIRPIISLKDKKNKNLKSVLINSKNKN